MGVLALGAVVELINQTFLNAADHDDHSHGLDSNFDPAQPFPHEICHCPFARPKSRV